MSIKTWKKEFYPKKPSKRMSKIDAIKHSIKKWEGLTKDNLERHELIYSRMHGELVDENGDNEFEISADNCSLCIKYIRHDYEYVECVNCPLYQKLGSPCGSFDKNNEKKDGWDLWIKSQNPDLMIENLKSLLVED